MSRNSRRLETVESLAERFSLPRRTIVREVMQSRLPYVSVAGEWRFREREIRVWLQRAGSLPRLRVIEGGRREDAEATIAAARDAWL